MGGELGGQGAALAMRPESGNEPPSWQVDQLWPCPLTEALQGISSAPIPL
jgi:hypothetical protein